MRQHLRLAARRPPGTGTIGGALALLALAAIGLLAVDYPLLVGGAAVVTGGALALRRLAAHVDPASFYKQRTAGRRDGDGRSQHGSTAAHPETE